MSFRRILDQHRKQAFSERDKGDRFERLMQAYLQTDPTYAHRFSDVWLWNEFFGRKDLGSVDTGVDLVARTKSGEYWAIQCKCYAEGARIEKKHVDTFLSTSGRSFKDQDLTTTTFSHRLWIDTIGKKWSSNAEEAIRNQRIPVSRIGLFDLQEARVDWEKIAKGISGESARAELYETRPHQTKALEDTHTYFKDNDRGKLIMACGTGKTFTALRIAENETNNQGLILFLVPSIALIGQTLREWYAQAVKPINAICICSDPDISRLKQKGEDADFFSTIDLGQPASTDVPNILKQFEHIKNNGTDGLTVVFSTYQSIDVIAQAQQQLLQNEEEGIFDLIICDEAHRTTGVTLANEDESAFVRVHNNEYLQGRKRLYMTATPRLYDPNVKDKAAQEDVELCSMDDPEKYGDEIYRIGFGEAVQRNLLTDYKVLILTMSDNDVPRSVQNMIADAEQEINSDDASKLIGCINALSKQIVGDENNTVKKHDPQPMRRAVAFCSRINPTAYSDATASTTISNYFNAVSEEYLNELPEEEREGRISPSAKHIDGTMSAPERDELLSWLKEDSDDECRILTNVRCLSEGVDVPSLDAVMFLSARNSEVDVVQSVGRVMRKAPGKKYGYIIIPVVVPSDVEPDVALNDNKRFAVVWTVLNALRAHDDRFNAIINKIDLNKQRPANIQIVGAKYGFDDSGDYFAREGDTEFETSNAFGKQFAMQFETLQSVLYARLVKKVGNRRYWEQWATNVGEIATRQMERITHLVKQEGEHKEAFEKFLKGLKTNINDSISEKEAIEMLSQHMITKPVFEALFEKYSFVANNAVSSAMEQMVGLLEQGALEKDTKALKKFYDSVRMRAEGIDNAEGKQKIIIELYDTFFKTAFPRMVDQLGIVYTPTEVVDFILHSVEDVLQKEFGQSISDEDVHILDPFTGTGTFITRLLQSGLIKKEDLPRKYEREIHANEIVLLAYYIADVNIENTYHDVMGITDDYKPFDGICLTDTFQLGEIEDSVIFSEMFPENSERLEMQRKGPIRVIVGNPPYSVGQKSANDNAQNQKYNKLDQRITETYAKISNATSVKALYDAYIKAFRWSSDRIDSEAGGVLAFVSNGAWLDSNGMDGFRKVLEEEFSSIWVFNLRGNQRTSGELSRKEGGKIFGSGSRTPISITLLVKNPKTTDEKAKIYYHDIGDYLSREEKLKKIRGFKSVDNSGMNWKTIEPNEHGDWLNQRSNIFENYYAIQPNKKFDLNTKSIFNTFALGVVSARDSWVYNFSRKSLEGNIKTTINFYNEELIRFNQEKIKSSDLKPLDFLTKNSKKISWSRTLRNNIKRNKKYSYNGCEIIKGSYRPFVAQNLYFSNDLVNDMAVMPQFIDQAVGRNPIIVVSGIGSNKGFSSLITTHVPDFQILFNSQCFPLYYFEERELVQGSLFDGTEEDNFVKRDGISDFILTRARTQYGSRVEKEDIFYYVYGILHSPDYRQAFSNDLKKMLPRIPLVDAPRDFWKFSKAGRELAELHVNYEDVPPYDGVVVEGEESDNFRVSKMRFPRKSEKDTILYNGNITISNIPEKAYEYVVNGKSAIEWIMERYQVKTDKKSGITNDPNDWADEVGNPRYILDLLLSVINVSVQTVDIVNSLPELEFEEMEEVTV